MDNLEARLIEPAARTQIRCLIANGALSAPDLVETVATIAELGLTDCVGEIEGLLSHENVHVKLAVLDALSFAFTSHEKAGEILTLMQTDEDEDVRAAAAGALGSIAKRKLEPVIMSELISTSNDTSESDVVRDAASRAYKYALRGPAVGEHHVVKNEAL